MEAFNVLNRTDYQFPNNTFGGWHIALAELPGKRQQPQTHGKFRWAAAPV